MSKTISAFVTICNQRSGSKFVGSCFRQGLDVIPLGEIFNPDGNQMFSYWTWLSENSRTGIFNPTTEIILDQFFNQIYDRFGPFHFDLMYNQLAAVTPAWWDKVDFFILDYLKRKNFSILHLTRDPLKTFKSLKVLEITNTPHRIENGSDVYLLPVEISVIELSVIEFRDFKFKLESFSSVLTTFFMGHKNFLHFDFSDIDLNSGFLPDFVRDFCANELFERNSRHGSSVQLKPTIFGKSPESNLKISNINELMEINSENGS